MDFIGKLKKRQSCVAVVGLGYVGLPLAVAFAKKVDVIGFDISENNILRLKEGIDYTNEVGNVALKESNILFTNDENQLKNASFIIIAVPTPIKEDFTPDLDYVISASEIVGKNLQKNTIVIYESTVYPGVTEEICLKTLEKFSNLECGKDFYIGYSPERINPGDRVHTLKNITKIVSGMNDEVRDEIKQLYKLVVDNVYEAESIKIAESAKLLENTQRDINIAFMNEVAMIFSRLGISTSKVIEAMNTKWNALGFKPGLVGGHCIGIDPYYLIYKATLNHSSSEIVALARKINNNMSEFVIENIIQKLIKEKHAIKSDNIYILGITFKENCPDIRNSRVIDIISRLKEYEINLKIVDPYADKKLVKQKYNIDLMDLNEINDADCLIFAVEHDIFKKIKLEDLRNFTKNAYKDNKSIIIDIKNIFDGKFLEENGFAYWGL